MRQALDSRWHSAIEVRIPQSRFIERGSTSLYVFLKTTQRNGTLVQEESWPLEPREFAGSKRLNLLSRLSGITRQLTIKITSFSNETTAMSSLIGYRCSQTSASIVFQSFCSIYDIQIAEITFSNLPWSIDWPISIQNLSSLLTVDYVVMATLRKW